MKGETNPLHPSESCLQFLHSLTSSLFHFIFMNLHWTGFQLNISGYRVDDISRTLVYLFIFRCIPKCFNLKETSRQSCYLCFYDVTSVCCKFTFAAECVNFKCCYLGGKKWYTAIELQITPGSLESVPLCTSVKYKFSSGLSS